MALDLENSAHRLMDALGEAAAFDSATAARHRRLRDEALAQSTTTRALRSVFVDRQLDLAERDRALQTDVLLICATEDELAQLKAAAEKRALAWEPSIGAVGPYFKLGRVGSDRVSVIRLKAIGSHSADGSAFTCHRARAETGAASVIGVGIAFGISEEKQRVGDVIVSSSIFLYEDCTVKETDAAGFRRNYPARAKVLASEPWVDRFHALRRSGWKPPSGHDEGMHVGTILAGSTRIESATYRDDLATRVPKSDDRVVGGEMEAAGIAAACREPAQWVVVKGISDFGTVESRKAIKDTRVVAARAAAECVLDALERAGSR